MSRYSHSPTLPLSRRELLSRCGMGFGALGLAALLGEQEARADGPVSPLAVRQPHFAPKAKRVIHIFANGGPSHVDTFDYKPALAKYAGQPLPSKNLQTERKTGSALPSPFKFQKYGKSGLEISEIFGKVAQHADDLCVVRSMQAELPNHEPSLMLMNCGDGLMSRPSMGSWVTYGLGSENQNLPGFIVLCPGGFPIKESENWQSSFLPGVYAGTFIDTQHTEIEKLIEHIRNSRLPLKDQRRQLNLIQKLNAAHRRERPQDSQLEARIQSFELAYRMQMEAADVFDVSKEPQHVRERYGSGVHGRQMLIARRLLEKGVRFVQVWHGAGQPWDNHDKIEENHGRLARETDGPIAALLTDLKERGMLEDTLVIWGGEFGRTPTVELQQGSSTPTAGRDHNHYGFSMWLAGGGVKGGYAYGATDELGFKAEEKPVHVHDLHATLLHLLGFDHTKLTYRYAGRDFRLTDVHGNLVRELIA
ncbi:MAG: DUF1501 domain-containing protein [Armatimonadota bacterium]